MTKYMINTAAEFAALFIGIAGVVALWWVTP